MSQIERTKVCHEELFDKFREAAQQWLKETPEAQGLSLVVNWNTGQNDFPPVAMTIREQPTEKDLLATMGQALKYMNMLSDAIREQLLNTKSVIKQAEAIIKQASTNK